jgi:hypothetical protein
MARLFVSQQQMDRWTSEGKVKLDDDIMSVPAMHRSFRISGAVYFTKLIDGEDKPGLIGKVKSGEQLAEMSAEHYGASVILGEVGYECVEGFIGVPVEADAPVAGSGLLKL